MARAVLMRVMQDTKLQMQTRPTTRALVCILHFAF
jgi:hypothetical protein